MKPILYFISIMIISSHFSMAQKNEQCKDLLKAYSNQLKNIGSPKGKNAYHLDMRMKAEMRPGSQQPNVEEHLLVYASADNYVCEGNQVSTYIDKENAFSVLHNKKVIYWAEGSRNAAVNNVAGNMLFIIQDSLIKVSAVGACKQMVLAEKSFKLITLLPPSDHYALFKIVQADYYYDETKKIISKVILYYTPENPMEKMTMSYEQVDYAYKKSGILLPAIQKVFSANKKLIPRYSKYQIVTQKG